jgi:co-chaperonin GroES (HSP10)
MSQFRPLGRTVHIQPDNPEAITRGGIHVATQKKPTTGTVIAISPDYCFSIAVGDKVTYSNNHAEYLEDGTLFLSEDSIELY